MTGKQEKSYSPLNNKFIGEYNVVLDSTGEIYLKKILQTRSTKPISINLNILKI